MSQRPPRPQGYPWLTPYFVVRDPEAAIAFYEKAFGFEKRMAVPGKDGKPMHVEMTWRDGMIMFGPEHSVAGQYDFKSPASRGIDPPVGLYVYCDDVDAQFARATAAGARTIRPPQNQFYGDRTCTVQDADGYWWHFATNVADFDPSKPPPC